jgi:nicotinamidase/pyrazinamidase
VLIFLAFGSEKTITRNQKKNITMSHDPPQQPQPQPGVTLLLVDVQKDFHSGGSLAIPTADADAIRIAAWIDTHQTSIQRIVATMDSHPKLHIAHPGFWINGVTQQHPPPFTIITSDDVRNGIWKPRDDLRIPVSHLPDPKVFFPAAAAVVKENNDNDNDSNDGSFDLYQYCIDYTSQLEAQGRFQLCIWPEHCLIGSTGHGMVDIVLRAVMDWSAATGQSIEWIMKGQNMLSEMYSALAAEVPITIATTFQSDLHHELVKSSRLVVCGQASSHCVNHTVRDIVAHWPADRVQDIVILSDCTSPVPGFEGAADTFCADMKQAGVQWLASTDSSVL